MKETKDTMKMIVLILLCGICMGGVSTVFLKSLAFVGGIQNSHLWIMAFLPVVGILTAVAYTKYGKNAHKGNNLIIESTESEVEVPFRMGILTFVFTVLAHLVGGSVGREGTAVQIGGTVSNKLAKWFHLEEENKRLLVHAGISAGFGSVFGTPLAGAFFGMEMPYMGKLNAKALMPCFMASFVADQTAILLGTTHAHHHIVAVPHMDFKVVCVLLISCVLFGIAGRFFSITIHKIKEIYQKAFSNFIIRAFMGSCLILLAMFLVKGFSYAGLSTWMIDAGFQGQTNFLDPIRKFFLTCMTLGAGFQGGEVTPLFDIGASLGGAIGSFSGVEPSFLAALGMITVFGCAANTPIATIMLGIDLFGAVALPYYGLASLIGYYVTGHHGIYGSQTIVTVKNKRHLHHEGLQLGEISRK